MTTALRATSSHPRSQIRPRIAANHLVALSSTPEPHWSPVVIRLATAGDRHALEALAQLDSATPPPGETLIGETLGRPVAALSLADGKVIADPFVTSGDVVDLLRLRAHQMGLNAVAGPRRRPGYRV